MTTELTAWNRLKTSVLSTAQVRQVDQLAIQQYGMHSLVLMENAALGCVQWICQRFPSPRRTVILGGRGNNGGDGLVIARHLQVLGWPVTTILWGPEDKLSADAKANLRILQVGSGSEVLVREAFDDTSLELLSKADLVVDAMLGTGATGNPRSPLDAWIRAANELTAFRLAIDLPTGIDGDTGTAYSPAFRADATLSFVALKPAMTLPDSQQFFGEVAVLPIGIPDSLVRYILEGL